MKLNEINKFKIKKKTNQVIVGILAKAAGCTLIVCMIFTGMKLGDKLLRIKRRPKRTFTFNTLVLSYDLNKNVTIADQG